MFLLYHPSPFFSYYSAATPTCSSAMYVAWPLCPRASKSSFIHIPIWCLFCPYESLFHPRCMSLLLPPSPKVSFRANIIIISALFSISFSFSIFCLLFFCARLLSLMLTLTLSMVYCIYIYIYLSSFNFFNLLNLGGGLWFFLLIIVVLTCLRIWRDDTCMIH